MCTFNTYVTVCLFHRVPRRCCKGVLRNGTLQNGNVTKWYVLQNGTCYKTVRVTKLQNCTLYKLVSVTKRYYHKMVRVTKQYITKQYSYKTVHFLYCTMNAPTHGLVEHLS